MTVKRCKFVGQLVSSRYYETRDWMSEAEMRERIPVFLKDPRNKTVGVLTQEKQDKRWKFLERMVVSK